jgi:hypothetical protein
VDDLATARAARDNAIDLEQKAFAALKEASIQASFAIDGMDGTQASIAKEYNLSSSTLSKLNPSEREGNWAPLGIGSYQVIDKITGGKFRLAALRRALDKTKQQVKKAKKDVSLAETRTDVAHATLMASAKPRAEDSTLVIDDVQIDRRPDQVVLDIRVRNEGERAVDITRAAVRILAREEFLTAYAPTAHYDLLVDGDYNEVGVAHHVKPDDVDRFTLALGFVEQELGCVFTAELVLRFNRDHVAVSKQFTFNSCFE